MNMNIYMDMVADTDIDVDIDMDTDIVTETSEFRESKAPQKTRTDESRKFENKNEITQKPPFVDV